MPRINTWLDKKQWKREKTTEIDRKSKNDNGFCFYNLLINRETTDFIPIYWWLNVAAVAVCSKASILLSMPMNVIDILRNGRVNHRFEHSGDHRHVASNKLFTSHLSFRGLCC